MTGPSWAMHTDIIVSMVGTCNRKTYGLLSSTEYEAVDTCVYTL